MQAVGYSALCGVQHYSNSDKIVAITECFIVMFTSDKHKPLYYGFAAVVVVSLFMLVACGDSAATPSASGVSQGSIDKAHTIVIGDVDPDEPVKKVRRFQPLADYLAQHLQAFGIQAGRVVIASNIEEMGGFLKEGEVDIYFDSPYPALTAQKLSGSEFLLIRAKEGVDSYWSTFVVRRGSGVTGGEDLLGKIVSFEEPRSTSGFVLPAGTLIQQGFALREVAGPGAQVSATEIGYFFSRDEENTIELVSRGQVAAGGISIQDYQELPPELMEQLTIFERTITVPRQIVSVRPGLDPALKAKLRELLLGLKDTEEGRTILQDMKHSAFDPLPVETEAALAQLDELIDLVAGN